MDKERQPSEPASPAVETPPSPSVAASSQSRLSEVLRSVTLLTIGIQIVALLVAYHWVTWLSTTDSGGDTALAWQPVVFMFTHVPFATSWVLLGLLEWLIRRSRRPEEGWRLLLLVLGGGTLAIFLFSFDFPSLPLVVAIGTSATVAAIGISARPFKHRVDRIVFAVVGVIVLGVLVVEIIQLIELDLQWMRSEERS